MPNTNDDHTIQENLARLVSARTAIATAITSKGGTVIDGDGFEDYPYDISTIPEGSSSVIIEKPDTITTNGTYEASTDEADGYSSVTVNVPNTYTSSDNGKVVQNQALVSQTAYNSGSDVVTNGTIDTTYNNSVTINVPTYSAADNGKVIQNGALVAQSTNKSITSNGTGIDTTYYSSVDVAVPNTYTASDEGKVVSSGALVAQTSSSTTVNGVIDTTLINSLDVSVPTGMSDIEYNTDNDPVLTKTINGTTTNVTTPDTIPTANSKNLITSGAVHETIVDANTALELILYGFPYKDKDGTKPFMMGALIWSEKTWTGLTSFGGSSIWTDGDNIYYSSNGSNYVLDKSTSTWSSKTWYGLTSFSGSYIWTDGTDIYYSFRGANYVLDKSTSTWSSKSWTGLTNFYGEYIWTDGTDVYYSSSSTQYVLDKSTSTWSTKSWNGLSSFYGNRVWTDGTNIYYSYNSDQYVLDKSTSTWSTKVWSGYNSLVGYSIWTDGDNIYYSSNSDQYVLTQAYSLYPTTTCKPLLSIS